MSTRSGQCGHADDKKDRNDRLWFLLSCATHPEADADGTLGPELWKCYEWTTWWPEYELSPTYRSTTFEEQYQAPQEEDSNLWLGLTRSLEDDISIQDGYTTESIEHIIKHFLWLLLNVVDVHLVVHRTGFSDLRSDEEAENVLHEGYELPNWSLKLVLRNPFSDTPKSVCEALATANTRENIEFLGNCPLPEFYENVPLEQLHAFAYIIFLHYALAEVDQLGSRSKWHHTCKPAEAAHGERTRGE